MPGRSEGGRGVEHVGGVGQRYAERILAVPDQRFGRRHSFAARSVRRSRRTFGSEFGALVNGIQPAQVWLDTPLERLRQDLRVQALLAEHPVPGARGK